jgi:hypothetical protein
MIGSDEARLMAAFGRRLQKWDPSTPVRLVTTSSAFGVYTAPPMQVLSFIAVPLKGAYAVDRTVTLSSFIDAMDAVAASGDSWTDTSFIDAPPSAAQSVAFLPPSEGWQIPLHAISGDLLRNVAAVGQEFSTRAHGLPAGEQQQIADEIWDRPSWAGLPVRVLHAAYRLGMLLDDQSRVAAATCGSWRRFATPRGQVFYRVPGDAARFDLHVVR